MQKCEICHGERIKTSYMTKAVCSTVIRIVTTSQDYELVYDRFSVYVMCF